MALLWADDFKSFGTDEGAMLDGLYAEMSDAGSDIALVADPDVTASGNVLRWAGGFLSNNTLRWVNPNGAVTTLGMGCRFWAPSLPTGDDRTFEWSFRDANNVTHICLEVMTTGQLRLRRGGEGGTELGQSTLPVLTAAAWHHIEFKALIDNTVGTFQCYVNGIEVDGLTLTGIDTCNSAVVSVSQIAMLNRLSSGSGFTTFYMKDFIVWDNTGTVNNDFMGTVSVLRLL